MNDFDVVIIGAGPSGIAALNQFITSNCSFNFICFESRNGFGGIWNQENKEISNKKIKFKKNGKPYQEENPINAKIIYENLRTNVPKEIMGYRNRPFLTNNNNNSINFPTGQQVTEYLNKSSKGLEKFVKFNRFVKQVKYNNNKSNSFKEERRWIIQVINLSSSINQNQNQTFYCDFVLACNGHNNVPYIPFIPSLWTWPKEMIHSCNYSGPTDPIFENKNVAVIGNGPSGYDIVRELAILREKDEKQKKYKIYSISSHIPKLGWDFNDPNSPSWTKLIKTLPKIKKIEKNLIFLTDNNNNDNDKILNDIDLIYFATGYLYSFKFCNQLDEPWNRFPIIKSGLRVHNLDQTQMFYYPDPSFAFLVLQSMVLPLPMAEFQARAIIARWSGRKKFELFPMKDEEDENENETKSVHYLTPPADFEYQNKLLDLINEGGIIDNDETWGYIPNSKFLIRQETKEKRRIELGY